MQQPPTGWTTQAKVVGVHDGDTITVDVTRRIRVRLLDCWAPEVRTRNLAEKVAGIAAQNHLRTLLPIGAEVRLHVPTDSNDIGDWMTLSRVLGRVWLRGVDVAEEMVQAGLAGVAKH